MINSDVHSLTADDFRQSRRRVLERLRAKERDELLNDISRRLVERVITQEAAMEERINANNVAAERW